MRWSGVLVVCGALVVSVLAGCGGLTDQGDDTVNGKQLFVSKCGSCHVLGRAGTKGVTGPNLDQAFARSREDGFGESTFKGVVHRQILQPNKFAQVDPATGKTLPLMPAKIVTGEDAKDIAAYVASAVSKGGKDPGRLASIGAAEAKGTAKASNGKLEIPADPGGALAYKFANADGARGPAAGRLAERVVDPARHRGPGQRRRRGRQGGLERRHLDAQRRPQARQVRLLLHGARPPRGRHGGHARR